jgi:hypothetical protein
MSVARPGAYPRVEHLKGVSLGWAPASPSNIRLGWRGVPGKNTLAYYKSPLITAVISFNVQVPEAWFTKLFTVVINPAP